MEKVALQPACGIWRDVFVEEEATELLAGSQNLTTSTAAPTYVHRREVEQLQRTSEGVIKTKRVTRFLRPDGAIDLAADVCELLH
jgi:hypothetical protein